MHKKTILLTLLITIFTTAILIPQPTTALQIAKVSTTPKTISGTDAEVGKNFTITITVAEVTKLHSYQLLLAYNTTILTATSFKNRANETYAPFNNEFKFEINDNPTWNTTTIQDWTQNTGSAPEWGNKTAYLAAAYYAPLGDSVGITTTDPIPLADITLRIDALGTTDLDLLDNNFVMGTTTGDSIRVDWNNLLVADAFFSNTQIIQLHDVAVTTVSTSTSTANPGDTIAVDVTVTNPGNFNENVTVFIKYNTSATDFRSIGTPKAINNLAPAGTQTESFTWNTAGIPTGKYIIRAEASITQDDDPTNNIRNSDIVTLATPTGFPTYIIYIAVGVVLVVVLAVGFYLRGRGKKP